MMKCLECDLAPAGRGPDVKEPVCGALMPIRVLKREFRLPSAGSGCSVVGGDSPDEK
jgi:hypothetical protein